ncbi:dinuclear metal center protein, YbgI/SA1388 family [Cyclonatronum proteinivorum]|uniref:GTP cyclohydrolase 1 type 2 homolog n=1 Tax=Cyclonatronum proteinivorum TaxID=1457365 RepID=A0A345UHC6_9BACT|nr:Nif3-like dinuclear metal center hexameric protein [Cyclonatronum proteinivorum]AXI99877.1 dinuclear metal center protein, YbgI/SA1388 family [Cyclonatronum proteinivorum]
MNVLTRHISDFFEHWAPNATKQDYDNTGLLIGNPNQPVTGILCCLDVTADVIDEAAARNCQLICAHHPLIFPKLKRVVTTDETGALIHSLIRNNISVIAAHTNLDAARDGVSFALAQTLELTDISMLDDSYKTMKRVIFRFPAALKPEVSAAIRNVDLDCGWSEEEMNISVARFNADVYVLNELRSRLLQILDGAPHSFDIVALESSSPLYGFGALGKTTSPMTQQAFLDHVAAKLGSSGLRFSGEADAIKKVAVCGGSGSFLIRKAQQSGAQAFITADIKYHDFFVPKGFLLIDAGHYETEAPIIAAMQQKLASAFPDVQVISTSVCTNPMQGWPAKSGNTVSVNPHTTL